MATNSESANAASAALDKIVSSGVSEWQEGNQRFKMLSPAELLDLTERLEARAAEDAGAKIFKPLVEFYD